MHKLLLLLPVLFFYFQTSAQISKPNLAVKHISSSNQEWIQMPSAARIQTITFFEEFGEQLGLGEKSSMELIRKEHDANNWKHLRYQQYYDGIKIQGSEFILHEHNDELISANGRIEANLQINTQPAINPGEAIGIALKNDLAKKYIWEVETEQKPNAELIIIDEHYPERSGNLVLAYKIELFSLDPIQKIRYFINAHTGEVIISYNTLMSCFGAPGAAQTLYTGTQNIETEESNGEHILHDLTRGEGITTQSAKGTQYTDSDNFWEEASFTQKVGALDAHYGAQKTYDFYKNSFNRDGINGKNARILLKIIDTTSYVNAFWETATQSLNFGIGDGIDTGPLTTLDVVGHEMTHGVTEHTCGLEYLYEAGAMNEALSDIFGKSIEHKYDSAHYDWLIGSKFFFKPDTAFRSMSDPNRFKNPRYYKGKNWNTGSGDNGGVHTNSGVLNYWFYLLVTGQSGTNEAGKTFDVKAMGFEATTQLIYQMMTNYLISTSYYHDAKEASLQVAENLYGKCSDEYKNIAEAWRAVGVGNGVVEGDLLLSNYKIPQVACKEGLFPVEVRLTNQSCSQIISKDTDIRLTVSVPQKNKIIETYTLDKDILPGESILYKFISPARIDKTATLITIEAMMLNDADTTNNRFNISISKNNNSDHDFRVSQVNVNGSPCESNNLQATIQASYSGCSPVPAGTELDLILKYDNEVINKKLKTVTTLYPNANYRSTAFGIDRSFSGYKRIQAFLNYSSDTVTNNNSAAFNAVYINNTKLGYLEPFDNNQFDSSLLALRVDSFQILSIQSNISNSPAMVFSGGQIFDSTGRFIPNNGSIFANFFSSNSKFSSTIYLCLDTKDLTKAFLSFDYMQKIGDAPYDTILVNPNFAAGTRVQFRHDRGNVIGSPTYLQNASTESIMRFHEQEIPITGGPVSIEITNLSLEGKLDSAGTGIDLSKDYVLMDNINIHADAVSTSEESYNALMIYPNPFSESFTIYLKDSPQGFEYSLYNIYGVKILEGKSNSNELELKTGYLPTGNYILKTHSGLIQNKSYSLIKM
jgi:Zn-dependent metalloprotease